MNDTHTLLGQLKIDRGDDEEPPRRGWRWLLAALLVLLAAAAIIWMMRDTRVPVSDSPHSSFSPMANCCG